jgi:hypothetical protein
MQQRQRCTHRHIEFSANRSAVGLSTTYYSKPLQGVAVQVGQAPMPTTGFASQVRTPWRHAQKARHHVDRHVDAPSTAPWLHMVPSHLNEIHHSLEEMQRQPGLQSAEAPSVSKEVSSGIEARCKECRKANTMTQADDQLTTWSANARSSSVGT